MKQSIPAILLLSFVMCSLSDAQADTFGSGANSFEIEFVSIGDPGNPADTSGSPNPAGAVDYLYRMGKFEISESMIDKANALADLGITKDSRGPDKPATSVDWFEAAKFVNWLNISTGHTPAYKFVEVPDPNRPMLPPSIVFELWEPTDAGYDPANLFRNRLAKYVLPNADEWYKAAYFDPSTSTWYDYPTGSNSAPASIGSGTAPGTAVYRQDLSTGPADIMNAGGLSPFGTMAQGGNVAEWEETEFDLLNDDAFSPRGGRGGFWDVLTSGLSATSRSGGFPDIGHFGVGFRVASIPEPDTLLLIIGGVLGALSLRRRST